VNSLNGFYDDIVIRIGSNEQIGNIVIATKNELEKVGTYTVARHRELVDMQLTEMAYDKDVIVEWLFFID